MSLAQTGTFFYRHTDAPVTQFQVMGERGSGTNMVRKTLELNTTLMRVETLGWKHGFPNMTAIPEHLVVVCVVRHAEAWARSMHSRPWHAAVPMQALSFSEFIRAQWQSVVDRPRDFEALSGELDVTGQPLQYDRHPMTGQMFPNLFALRAAKLTGLLSMANRECSFAVIQLEAMTSDPQQVIEAFCAAYALPMRQRQVALPRRRMGNNFNTSIKTRPATPARMSAEDQAFMQGELDMGVERYLGYLYDTDDMPQVSSTA